jgi:DNA-binding winged helix-turn-helix (wHTH) protein/TolB-like protein/Flp pilus assembly protein TadD
MASADRRVRFEDYGFDPDTGEVIRDGVPVARLQEQPARVLDALISRAGSLVTRDDLRTLLWPDNSLVDADNGLNIAVSKIRLALGDSAAQPRFVQTVPRRGYRFIADVEPAAVPVSSATPSVAEPVVERSSHVPSRARWPRPAHLAAAALAVLALSFVIVIAWGRPAAPVNVRSAAVMPFANLAGDQELDYAVRGLSDTVATELGARGLHRVIAPEATAHYGGSSVSPVQAAGELHADALILGTVVRDGASYAVNVRVVDGKTGRQVWAKRFVRASSMELTFSDDVIAELTPALGLAPGGVAVERRQIGAAARNEYMRGRYFWNLRTNQGMTSAVEHLTRAIELQRDYALAWAGLADVYAIGSDVPSTLFTPWPGSTEAALRAAAEALRLDPLLGEAHAAIGKIRIQQWRWRDAEMELAEAVRRSPNDATARQWYGTLLARLRKCEGAIEETAIGGEIDPIAPMANEAVGFALSACGQPERAIPVYRRVLAMHADFATTHMRLAGAHLRSGDAGSALTEYREALRLRPDSCEIRARMVGALMAAGQPVDARSLAAEMMSEARRRDTTPYCIAIASVNIGDIDGAFAALDAVVAEHGPVDGLLPDFHLRPLHSDPRWTRLLDRIGLAPYARAAAQPGR